MNKKEKSFQMKRKGAMVGMVLCFVVVIAVVGMATFRSYENKMEEQIAKAEEKQQELEKMKETTQANTEDIVIPEKEVEDVPSPEMEPATDEVNVETTHVAAAAFTEDSILDWPASGNVLMNFSMDQTTYFSTLEQYKYNPALIVGGTEGEPIYAAAAGTVKSVEELAQTGMTVTLDMGNGYEAVYGQLRDVEVSEGEYLVRGEILGYLNQPTKYYSVEGTNLYFEVKKDGVSVNPMDYME